MMESAEPSTMPVLELLPPLSIAVIKDIEIDISYDTATKESLRDKFNNQIYIATKVLGVNLQNLGMPLLLALAKNLGLTIIEGCTRHNLLEELTLEKLGAARLPAIIDRVLTGTHGTIDQALTGTPTPGEEEDLPSVLDIANLDDVIIEVSKDIRGNEIADESGRKYMPPSPSRVFPSRVSRWICCVVFVNTN